MCSLYLNPDNEEQEVAAVHVKFYNKKMNKFVEYIDAQEVCFALPSFGPMKAAGPDGLKPLTLQRLTDKLLAYLTNLFRICANAGNAPKVWRVMKVVFLPKAGEIGLRVGKVLQTDHSVKLPPKRPGEVYTVVYRSILL